MNVNIIRLKALILNKTYYTMKKTTLYQLFLLIFVSAFKNIDEFITFLKSLNWDFDIIILTETWTSINKHNLFKIDGYNCEHSVRSDRQGGGVCFYINKSLS